MESNALVVCRDAELVQWVMASAAAVGATPDVVRTPTQARRGWAGACAVFVGAESAAMVAGLALAARTGVHVIGRSADEVLAWSAPLDASVLVLPQQVGLIGPILAGAISGPTALLVTVTGGSGGVGASTLACALAQVAVGRGRTAAVVELDPFGGGIDVVFGAETEPGWRWGDLSGASGHVSDLAGQLPNTSGVDIVANSRDAQPPGDEAVRAIVASLARSHDLVVLDRPAGPWRESVGVLVVAAEARAVLSARARLEPLGLSNAVLAVRTGPGRRIAPSAVADAVGLGLAGRVRHDPRLPFNLEVGLPPARGKGRYARDCAGVLQAVLDV